MRDAFRRLGARIENLALRLAPPLEADVIGAPRSSPSATSPELDWFASREEGGTSIRHARAPLVASGDLARVRVTLRSAHVEGLTGPDRLAVRVGGSRRCLTRHDDRVDAVIAVLAVARCLRDTDRADGPWLGYQV